jgi:cysteinyl-tRNA synthetase
LGSGTSDAEVIGKFVAAMDDDLDTPQAIALVFDTVRRANTAMDKGDAALAASLASAVFEMCSAMGLELNASTDVDAEATEMARQLDAARAAKNFSDADRLRGELQARGYLVETTKDGTRVRRA